MDEREQNLRKEEKTDGMPEVMMEIPAEQKDESLSVSTESVTEILTPENKNISPERQTEPSGSDEPHIFGADQNEPDVPSAASGSDMKTGLPDDFAGSEASADSFEQNTTYVRTEEPCEFPQTAERTPNDRKVPVSEDPSGSGSTPEEVQDVCAKAPSEEETDGRTAGDEKDLYGKTSRSEEELYRQTGMPEGEQYRQAERPEGEQHRQTGRPEQEPYRRDSGKNEDWRSRVSRTNDTNGSFDSEEGRNTGNGGGRYSSSYDRYRFENPSERGPVNTPDPRFPDEPKKPSSGKENKKGKRGWIAAGIAAGVLAAAFLLFFGIRAALMSAVNTARSAPPAGAEAGAQAGAEAEAPAEEPEIAIGNPDGKTENPQTAGRPDTEKTERKEDMTVPEVVQMCLPSMVAITNTTVEEYRDYFGGTRTYENVSAGSGIIIGGTETELLIATNNHVIANSSDITVTFIDDSVCTGTIKGQASDEDLAIISVNLSDISPETKEQIAIVALGNSDDLQVGETVVAIGNALGYGQSVSRGVVSALNRDVTVDGVSHTLIQTDASINPGNSGGALLNLRGELIGINEVKYVNTDVEGIGYAIPINVAEPILTNLGSRVQREKVGDADRAYIGIKCVGVNSEYVQYGYPAGVYVSEVTPGGPADQAGLRTGDIITAIDGVPVSSTDQLLDNLEYYAAGETVDFSVSRQAEQIGTFETTKIPITLGRRSESGLDDPSEGNGTAAPEENSGNEERDDRGFPTMPE